MESSLDRKLEEFVGNLSELELANYRVLLCLAAGELAPNYGKADARNETIGAFNSVQRSLCTFVPSEMLYRGRPAFLTDELLASFIREAEQNKAETFVSGGQLVGAGGTIANAFALSEELMTFMESLVPGGVHPTGIASYIHYDREGAGIEPHVDTDIFFINVLIMLSHVRNGDDPSTLVIYPAGQPMQRFLLEPGETVVIDAAGLIHGREPVKAGESVTILTIGFQPRQAAADRL